MVVLRIKRECIDKASAWHVGIAQKVLIIMILRKTAALQALTLPRWGYGFFSGGGAARDPSRPGTHATVYPVCCRCCQTHDCCYDHLKTHGCCVHTDHYRYSFSQGDIHCCEYPDLRAGAGDPRKRVLAPTAFTVQLLDLSVFLRAPTGCSWAVKRQEWVWWYGEDPWEV